MNWLSDIFSSTSDQARLVTTLIAATIAIAVVLLNQWFTSKRTRNIKLIEKIEEAYLAVTKLEEAFFIVHNEIVTNYHVYMPENSGNPYQVFDEKTGAQKVLHIDELNNEFHRHEAVAYMLGGLYFNELKEEIKTIRDNYQEMYSVFCDSESLSEYIKDGNDHREEIKRSFQVLYSKLAKIMNRYMR